MAFPEGFVWGAATSSYQIEGGAAEGGRGASIFEPFCNRPGAVFGGHSGAVATSHYHRWKEDVGIMRQIGLKAYRFSISWSRVLPDGVGRINQEGLDFYDRLVDELLNAGASGGAEPGGRIEPWVTLFHWDFPLALQHKGGWFNRDSAKWMAEYAGVVVDRLSDRVTNWMTINEPQVYIKFGYGDGTLAPGLKLGLDEQLVACHHALRAHGAAVQAIRARAKAKSHVGWALVNRTFYPATESPKDVEAARSATMGVLTPDLWNNTWYADPVFFGRYPEDGVKMFAQAPHSARVPIEAGDMELIAQPLDFYGVNIYDGVAVRARRGAGERTGGAPVAPGTKHEHEVVPFADGHPMTAFRWHVTPECLRWGPRFVAERYKVPVYVTENGLSNVDWVMSDGKVHDPQRIDYTRRYLQQLERAIDDGADIRGYFHWSLLDNFEWAAGYRERFGLVFVDYATGTRTVKESAKWYKKVIESEGRALQSVEHEGSISG